jgi:hypothetical protein
MTIEINELLDESTTARFLSKINFEDEDECWEWKAGKQSKKYGSFGIRPGKSELAHRVSYVYFVGEIPEELIVMHSCDNRLCCNPNHLRVGTIAENNQDAIGKGRNAKGEKNGHSKLTEEKVLEIRELFEIEEMTIREIARQYRMSYSGIHNIVHEKYWDLPLAK